MMKGLTDKEYLLLNAYYDGEVTPKQFKQAEALIKRNEQASEYLKSLGGITEKIQMEKNKLLNSDILTNNSRSNWSSLEARINQEERNAIYLGKRNQEVSSGNFITAFFADVFPSNLSKAFATACLAFVLGVVYKYSFINESNGVAYAPRVATSQIVDSSNTSFPVSDNQLASIPASTQVVPVANRRMELDWVKSDGRIRLIPVDDSADQEIIWVMTPSRLNGNIVVNK